MKVLTTRVTAIAIAVVFTIGCGSVTTQPTSPQPTGSSSVSTSAAGSTAPTQRSQAKVTPTSEVASDPTQAPSPTAASVPADPSTAPTEAESKPVAPTKAQSSTEGGDNVKLPSGYKKYTSKEGHYVLGLPKGWEASDMLGGSSKDSGSGAGGMDFFMNQDDPGVVLNILSTKLPGASHLDMGQFLEQMKSSGYKSYKQIGKMKIDGHEASIFQAKQKGTSVEQAIWTNGDRFWVATLAAPSDTLSEHDKEFRQILSTFHQTS